MLLAIALLGLQPLPALAWDTDNCSSGGRTADGACTVVSNGVEGSGVYGPVGRDTEFEVGETIGAWTSVNAPPGGASRWRFDYEYRQSVGLPWNYSYDSNTTSMTVTGGINYWSVWDDKFTTHPGGHYRVRVYYDPAGGSSTFEAVANGTVEFDICNSNYQQACEGGDLWWYDACGDRQGMALNCTTGETCIESGGIGDCVCDSHASSQCSSGHPYWYDSCDDREERRDTCSGGEICRESGDSASCVCDDDDELRCASGDIYWYDSCGNQGTRHTNCVGDEVCDASGGTPSCETTCTSQDEKRCDGGDAYWYDSCGNREDRFDRCTAGEVCSGGACICEDEDSTTCFGGDVYWVDSCGFRGSRAEECTGGRVCDDGAGDPACVCEADDSTRCWDGDVYSYDSCDSRGDLVDTCDVGETCAEGGSSASCGCVPESDTTCAEGDIYWVDSCGTRGGVNTRCEGGQACSSATGSPTCACAPNDHRACHDGDVYWFDSCGAATRVADTCGEGGCDAAECVDDDPGAGGPGLPERPFDPTCIISDEVFQDLATMGRAEIQSFLDAQPGSLGDTLLWQSFDFAYPDNASMYGWRANDGSLLRENSPADVIWFSSRDEEAPPNRINPQVLLVMLQKEQSLIERADRATQYVLDWAMGYGVPDAGGRDAAYRGFAPQTLNAAYQLTQFMSADPSVLDSGVPVDGGRVYPQNLATYALYRYTPHRNGNENFYTLFWRYFGDPGTCDGSPDDGPDRPTVSGLPGRAVVASDGALEISGLVEAGTGDRLSRVTLAVTGPGIDGSDTSMTRATDSTRFNLGAFEFRPVALGVSAGTFTVGVWAETDAFTASLLGQFQVTVTPHGDDGVAFLLFPLPNKTPDDILINSVFDHDMSTAYAANGRTVAFTGEEGRRTCGTDPGWSSGYSMWSDGECRAGTAFELRGQNRWAGTVDDDYLYYDDHPGYDFRSSSDDDVLAPAAGVVRRYSYTWGGKSCPVLEINHENGYRTAFLHLKAIHVENGARVDALQHVGDVGTVCTGGAHLHFEVRHEDDSTQGYHRVDPFGWLGDGSDPYTIAPNGPYLWLDVARAIGGEGDGGASCLAACSEGEVCAEGSCRPACATEEDCGAGDACVGGTCTSVCYPIAIDDCDPGVPFNRGDGDTWDGPIEAPEPEEGGSPGSDEAPDEAGGSDAGSDLDVGDDGSTGLDAADGTSTGDSDQAQSDAAETSADLDAGCSGCSAARGEAPRDWFHWMVFALLLVPAGRRNRRHLTTRSAADGGTGHG